VGCESSASWALQRPRGEVYATVAAFGRRRPEATDGVRRAQQGYSTDALRTHAGLAVSDVQGVLEAKRSELEAQLAVMSAPQGEAGGISFGKRVGEGTSMAVDRISSVAAHERMQDMLADVRRAQAKLAEGTYGTCEVCGEPIAPDRLEALPWAVRCMRDAGQGARENRRR
jgi:DnaK suppressor protein